ncbi:hypothetical protein RKD35_000066 [Streptomyces albogriseolus]
MSVRPVRATASASIAVSGGSRRSRALRAMPASTRIQRPRSRTTAPPAATAAASSSVRGSPSSSRRQRRSTVPSPPKKDRRSAGGVRSAPATARAVSEPVDVSGQVTSMPCPASRPAAPPSRSRSSSSVRSRAVGTGSRRASGCHTVAARRTARTMSAWARGPRAWSARANSSSASRARVGSARLWARGTRRGRGGSVCRAVAGASVSSTRRDIRTPESSPAEISSAQARSWGTCWGAVAANAARPVASSAAGVRGRVSATASRKARTSVAGSVPGTATASPGAASASARRRAMSSASNGPARQVS